MLLALLGGAAAGSECHEERGELICDHAWCLAYQQPAYAPDDPIAEACTWAIADHRRFHRFGLAVTGRLEDWLEGELATDMAAARAAYPEFDGAYPRYDEHVPGSSPAFVSSWMEGRDPPIRVRAAKDMLTQVLAEEARGGLPPRAGEPIRWSRAFHRRHPSPQFSRILVTLTFGASSRLLRTGREEALVEWILAQPPRSIALADLFRASYRTADGDVYLALLTAENVLSRHFLDPHRDRLAYTRRLRPLIDTWRDRGDNYGAWYHLFGMMLYSYARGPVAGWVSGTAETLGSKISNPAGEVEVQEGYANRAGSRLGVHLRRIVRTGQWERHADEPGLLAESAYMDLDEF